MEMAPCLVIVVSFLSRPSHALTMMSCKCFPLYDVFVCVHAPVTVRAIYSSVDNR